MNDHRRTLLEFEDGFAIKEAFLMRLQFLYVPSMWRESRLARTNR